MKTETFDFCYYFITNEIRSLRTEGKKYSFVILVLFFISCNSTNKCDLTGSWYYSDHEKGIIDLDTYHEIYFTDKEWMMIGKSTGISPQFEYYLQPSGEITSGKKDFDGTYLFRIVECFDDSIRVSNGEFELMLYRLHIDNQLFNDTIILPPDVLKKFDIKENELDSEETWKIYLDFFMEEFEKRLWFKSAGIDPDSLDNSTFELFEVNFNKTEDIPIDKNRIIKYSDKRYSDEIEFIRINNQELIENIEFYFNENLKEVEFEYALILDLREMTDSNKVEIFYEMNLSGLVGCLPKYYSRLDGLIVFIKDYSNEHELIKSSSTESLLKEVFEIQYEYYSSNGEYPPPITYSSPKWVFVGNELSSKGFR